MRQLLVLALLLAACAPGSAASPTVTLGPGALPRQTPDPAQVAGLAARRAAIDAALRRDPPVLRLPELPADARAAEELALRDPRLPLYDAQSGAPLLSEVFAVRQAGAGDLPEGVAAACAGGCWRVELYHYAGNDTSIVLVAPAVALVVDLVTVGNSQPADVPAHLAELAVAIARADPAVQRALAANPDAPPPVMANVKTALNATRCERAQHLCVAPTFHPGGQRALWAIVDLTELRLVGVQETSLGASGPPITERSVQDATVTALLCDRSTPLDRGAWALSYHLTGSDGLELRDVTFGGQVVLRSVKLPDWHISYSGERQFGYSDGIGCPAFSAAAVPAYSLPEPGDASTGGFTLTQNFQHPAWPHPCSYRYQQRWTFDADGSLTAEAVSFGRGCGDQGSYRPVLRLELAEGVTIAGWDGQGWQAWPAEGWQAWEEAQGGDPQGAWLRLTAPDGRSWRLVPRGADDAWLFVTRARPGEGDADLPTLGACCNTDHRQGPETFADGEALAGAAPVVWFVPTLRNSATPGAERCWANAVPEGGVYVARAWPCAAGVRLVPEEP